MRRVLRVEIRVPADLGPRLRAAAQHGGNRERVVFALASHMQLPDRVVVLIRKVVTLPDCAYIDDPRHDARWSGGAMLPVMNEALACHLGIFLFHMHQPDGQVALSPDDLLSANRLLPTFQNLVGARPHGSVVFSSTHVDGIAQIPGIDGYLPVSKLRWLGKVIDDLPREDYDQESGDAGTYHRQILLIGGRGQALLSGASVAVLGLCGGGSHVVQGLAHAGVGHIIGIDSDWGDQTNRHRMIGLTAIDVLLRRKKTAVMARLARRINRKIRFTQVPFALPDQRVIDALKQADIVVSCPDSLHARSDLQDLSWRFLVPMIDIGLLIVPAGEDRPSLAIGGNVTSLIPGQFCAWCAGLLSQEKLDKETDGKPRSYFKGTTAQAQVVSFNGVLANHAVSDVIQLLTGFAPIDSEYSIRKFDGVRGTLENWIVKKNPTCEFCGRVLAAGDMVWRRA